jgi:hypothetical protein
LFVDKNKWDKSGRLKNKNHKTRGTCIYLFHALYVNDSTFLLETLDKMELGSKVIYDHDALFVLIMRVIEHSRKSKTEALHISKKVDETPILAREQVVSMNNAEYFHFTNTIKYLRSIVTSCLRDSIDITTRISKAYGTIGATKEFFISRKVPLNIKLMLYLAIPLNTALWGCETWALLDMDKKALEVFHHRSIR